MTEDFGRKGLSGLLDLGGGKKQTHEHREPQTRKPGAHSETGRQYSLGDFGMDSGRFRSTSIVSYPYRRGDRDLDIPGFLDRRGVPTHNRPLSDDIRHLTEDDDESDEGRQEWRTGRLGARHFETALPQCKPRISPDGYFRLVNHDEMCALADAAYLVLLDVLSAQGFRITGEARNASKEMMRDIYEAALDMADHLVDAKTGELMPVKLGEDEG